MSPGSWRRSGTTPPTSSPATRCSGRRGAALMPRRARSRSSQPFRRLSSSRSPPGSPSTRQPHPSCRASRLGTPRIRRRQGGDRHGLPARRGRERGRPHAGAPRQGQGRHRRVVGCPRSGGRESTRATNAGGGHTTCCHHSDDWLTPPFRWERRLSVRRYSGALPSRLIRHAAGCEYVATDAPIKDRNRLSSHAQRGHPSYRDRGDRRRRAAGLADRVAPTPLPGRLAG